MIQENAVPRTSVHDIVRRSSTSQRFPDAEWLQSIGFVITETKHSTHATIVIDDYDKTSSKAHVDLRLALHRSDPDEWITDVISYNERGVEENAVGLVGSWLKTRAEVVRLCKALGVQLWRK